MMQRGEHLTAEGLQKIIGIRASLNRGLTPLLLEAFPNTVALVRPLLPPLKNVKLVGFAYSMSSWFYEWWWLF
nr:Ribosomal protein 3/homing endonuclease-like fusion protein n2 TaxGrosmannia RepIDC7SWE1_9PEZI [Fusarium pseudograminearum CS3487]CDX48303.1 Ribosomal protein 3/homing endonuclease-like fusion protein n2 TaxGrosmannia RepIDC7SWE1_9PEZI [Fusarium pseudograminearum CS3487]